jgi:hypothetical protein
VTVTAALATAPVWEEDAVEEEEELVREWAEVGEVC